MLSQDIDARGAFRYLETRRSSGVDYVPYCTLLDDVEPARRRISKPAGQLAPIAFNKQVDGCSALVRMQAS
jgi:hypothetical protein